MKSHILTGLILAVATLAPPLTPAAAQSIPEERRITHREQSLKRYNPFTADELWKKIPIPPAPALTPEEALKSFEVAPGFRIECVAAEPLVVDPVTFEFDADGRIWAVEFRGWMTDIDGSREGDPICRVVVLEDTDGDTFMDKSTVFLDKLVMPRTVSFVQGGVLVAEPPHLWFCKDVDGDLKCDSKTLVGKYGRQGSPEHTDNGLMHCIDNWMYSAKSTLRHKFADGKLIVEDTIFRGQWGMTQDDYGRLFYGYESSSLHADLFPAEYLLRNKHVGSRSSPGFNVKIAANAQEVYPIRVTPGITLGGTELREDGTLRTFTIVAGQSIYRGDQFPAEYYGHAVIPEAGGNLVRLDRMTGDGVHLETENAFGQREWLASTDERFRPVGSRTGPDGAVYICDLYRGIIEHVIFMMPYLRHQILSRGLDKPIGLGRIYRIVHEGKPLGKVPRMSTQKSRELVAHLSHPNGWWRDTAQRLLVERKAVKTAGLLREIATGAANPLGRIHALWTLEGIGELDWETVDEAIGDENELVRATAIRLAERFIAMEGEEIVLSRLTDAFSDRNFMVRLQLLLTLAEFKDERALEEMSQILIAHPDAVFGTAAVSGLQNRELEFIARLIEHPWIEEDERAGRVLRTLSTAVMNEGVNQRIAALLEFADADAKAQKLGWRADAMLSGILASDRTRDRWPSPIALANRPAIFDTLKNSSRESWVKTAPQLLRIVTWPGDTTTRPKKPVLKTLTEAQEKRRQMGEAIYTATCYACHKGDGRGDPSQAPPLAGAEWVNGDPELLIRIALQGLHGPVNVRGRTWELIMPGLGHSPILNDERMAAVLTYIRRAWDNYGDPIDPEHVASVRKATEGRAVPWTVEELLNPDLASAAPPTSPRDLLSFYGGRLEGGDAERGRVLFHTNLKIRCNACHKVGRFGGGFIGPDLTEVGARATSEYLVESLIAPNAKIVEGYQTMVITTKSGALHAGILVSENDKHVVLQQLTGESVNIPVNDIADRVLSPISTMPPVGTAFNADEIADLVAYLSSLKLANRDDGQKEN